MKKKLIALVLVALMLASSMTVMASAATTPTPPFMGGLPGVSTEQWQLQMNYSQWVTFVDGATHLGSDVNGVQWAKYGAVWYAFDMRTYKLCTLSTYEAELGKTLPSTINAYEVADESKAYKTYTQSIYGGWVEGVNIPGLNIPGLNPGVQYPGTDNWQLYYYLQQASMVMRDNNGITWYNISVNGSSYGMWYYVDDDELKTSADYSTDTGYSTPVYGIGNATGSDETLYFRFYNNYWYETEDLSSVLPGYPGTTIPGLPNLPTYPGYDYTNPTIPGYNYGAQLGTLTNPNNSSTGRVYDTNNYLWTKGSSRWTCGSSNNYSSSNPAQYIDSQGRVWEMYPGQSDWLLNNYAKPNTGTTVPGTGTGTTNPGTTVTATDPNKLKELDDTNGYEWFYASNQWWSTKSQEYTQTNRPYYRDAAGNLWQLAVGNKTWTKVSGSTGSGSIGVEMGGYVQYTFNGKTYNIPTSTVRLVPSPDTLPYKPEGYTWMVIGNEYVLAKFDSSNLKYETYPLPTVYQLPSGYYYYPTGDVEGNSWEIRGYGSYVLSDITEIEFTDYPYKLNIGETFQLKVDYKVENDDDLGINSVIIYSSSNPAVATVTQNGLVTIVGEGRADITARAFLGFAETMIDIYGVKAETVKPVDDIDPNTKKTVYDTKNYGWRLRDGVWTAIDSAVKYYIDNELNPIHKSAAGTTWYLNHETQTWTKTKPAKPYALPEEKVTDVFTDINANVWYADDVQFMYNWKTADDVHVMGGQTPTNFGPGNTLNRAMLMVILARMAGADLSKYTVSEFDDVDFSNPNHVWFAAAVAWAVDMGITNGKGEIYDAEGKLLYKNGFAPDAAITRAEACTFLIRYAKQIKGNSIPTSYESLRFADAISVASWAQEAVSVCDRLGFIDDNLITANKFNPNEPITRAEIASLIAAYAQRYGK